MGSKQRGMTLTELIITLALLSILVSMAAPGLQRFLQASRVTAQANDINAFLALARTEALQRFDTAVIEPVGGDWSAEWVIGVDTNSDNSISGSEVLHRMSGFTGGSFSIVDEDSNALGELAFDPRGWPATGATIAFYPDDCLGQNRRTITLKPTGDVNITKVDC